MARESRLRPGHFVGALLLPAPLVLPALVRLRALTPGLAYTLTAGRWLVALGAASALVSILVRSRGAAPDVWRPVSERLECVPSRPLWLAVWAVSLTAVWIAIPGHRWNGDSLGGDEPKYLRM